MAQPRDVFVHAQALCESDAVGPGTRVWAFAHVMKGARVGRDCNLCGGVFVEGGARIGDRVVVKNGVQVWDRVTLGDDVFVGPNATFTNDRKPRAAYKKPPERFEATEVGRGATIGANATLRCGIRIGEGAFVAAGAVVTSDVAPFALVRGVPARFAGWVCACGEPLPDVAPAPRGPLGCASCGGRYEFAGEGAGLHRLG
jgi:acetyltransferase-like isoleucine patch superfamily enzyme